MSPTPVVYGVAAGALPAAAPVAPPPCQGQPQDPKAAAADFFASALHAAGASAPSEECPFWVGKTLEGEHGGKVLTYDLYGFGMSSRKPRGARLDCETYVQQLEELLDSILGDGAHERPVHLFGHSMGGVIASDFARRYPQRVHKLTLTAIAGLMRKEETPCQPLLFGCLRRAWGGCLIGLVACLTACCGWYARRLLRRKTSGFEPDVREPNRFQKFSLENRERNVTQLSRLTNAYLNALRYMPLWEDYFGDAYRELADGPVPVMFIWGDEDNTVPWDESRDQIKEIFGPRGASCIILPGAGHGLCLEDAEQVAQLTFAWCRDLTDPAWRYCLDTWRLATGVGHAEPNVDEQADKVANPDAIV
eukprot:TRINITY_DN13002_c0_g1_i5.p1 TRINITY_DN13002_c0_g1~~TRINITY_DN13002_c0_g1_i5.p1  ORF type:complete len:363 (-),score=59.08 TRINITY_DN13002_c0_g1_i5:155-1243(-)